MPKNKIGKRINHLHSEIAAGGRHDGWTLKGLKKELKELTEKIKNEVYKRTSSIHSRG